MHCTRRVSAAVWLELSVQEPPAKGKRSISNPAPQLRPHDSLIQPDAALTESCVYDRRSEVYTPIYSWHELLWPLTGACLLPDMVQALS